jgi:hypothetical protein
VRVKHIGVEEENRIGQVIYTKGGGSGKGEQKDAICKKGRRDGACMGA